MISVVQNVVQLDKKQNGRFGVNEELDQESATFSIQRANSSRKCSVCEEPQSVSPGLDLVLS